MRQVQSAVARSTESVLGTNKLIRNTYTLLSMTLLFSALMAGVSMVLQLPPMVYMISFGGSILLLWLVLPRTANSAAGIGVVFAITGLMGLGLGPILNFYANLPNGPQIIATAMGGTGAIFLALSGYALTTKRDFSFMGGFLFAGLVVVLIAILANIFLAIPALSLAISTIVVLLMSGLILFDTSRMVNGGIDNYILATVSLYLNIYNLFIHLLSLLGILGGDE
ncbi:MAG: BAX inhibitor (BI)-1/YccA family protein [Proteobacteria bacterium]|nr:MAG: BAX inhibitor (BI)-1/YccA family protein [Pseudomonadota bacterium]QKK12302.1 MAG: Bax inhibitor-1/YccA family protein [Pseudomonadota bacterium]